MRNSDHKITLSKIRIHIPIFILIFSINSFADAPLPQWLNDTFKEIDNLNIKDPALALAQKTLNKHSNNLFDVDKVAMLSKMAQHNYFLGHIKQS